MKLFRYLAPGDERPRVGVVSSDGVAHALPEDAPDLGRAALASGEYRRVPSRLGPVLDELPRLLAPVADPCNVVGVSGNYDPPTADGWPPASGPTLFSKSVSAVCGPNGVITTARPNPMLDIEAELGVVVGREAWQVAERDALAHVFGYVIVNDVSDRSLQGRGDQWFRAKNGAGFCPLGPFLVPAAHVPLAEGLRIRSFVNGEPFQDGSTARMRYPVAFLLSYVSQFCRLLPGDIIATGAPAGFGLTRSPPYFLRDGDEVEISITGLGTQRQRVVLPGQGGRQ